MSMPAQASPFPPTSPARDLEVIAALCLGIMVATVIFVSFPGIDLWVSALFHDREAGFWLADNMVLRAVNKLISWVAAALIIFAVIGIGLALYWGRHLFGLAPRAFSFLLAVVVIGPGLIVNLLFKNQWGRARPRSLEAFGGELEFTPALVFSDQCDSNCSFVAGDPSVAFATLALALLITGNRRPWIWLALGFGVLVGLVRIVQGAHFLSDVVFSGLFVLVTAYGLKLVILEGRWGVSAAVERGAKAVVGWAVNTAYPVAREACARTGAGGRGKADRPPERAAGTSAPEAPRDAERHSV